jgi:DNA-binding CsgD family transcriptional regulator
MQLEKVNWTALSPVNKASLKLAALISSGLSPGEAGAIFGISTKSVNTAMAALREEIRAQRR